jgi:hypothetical protein
MAATLLLPAAGAALEIDLGGDSRYYQFLRIEDDDASRRDAELGVLRLKLQAREGEEWIADVHGVVSLTSPAATGASAIVTGSTPRLLDLEATVVRGEDVEVVMELDRLSLTWQRREFRLVVGRQAITWGVNFFWPVLDLFAPFAPERIDREYKPGVDAMRASRSRSGRSRRSRRSPPARARASRTTGASRRSFASTRVPRMSARWGDGSTATSWSARS